MATPSQQHPSMDGSSPSNQNTTTTPSNNQQNYNLNTSSSSSGSSGSPAMGHELGGLNQGHHLGQMGQRTLFPPPPSHHHHPHHQYNNGGPMMSSSPYGMPNHPQNYPGQSGKGPYRPWGAELAY